MIIDAHVHLVSDDVTTYPLRDGARPWPAAPVETLLAEMDAGGIERALAAQAYCVYGNNNRYLIDAAEAYPERVASGCALDPFVDGAPELLSKIVRNHGVRGLRLLGMKRPGVFRNPRTLALWARAAELGIPVFAGAQLADIPDLMEPLARFPSLPVAIEQRWATELGDALDERIAPVLRLASSPNVHLVLVPNHSAAARAAAPTPQAFFSLLAEHFGTDRLMWGSNFPVAWRDHGSIAARLGRMRADLAFLGDAACERIFGGTAENFWPQRGRHGGER